MASTNEIIDDLAFKAVIEMLLSAYARISVESFLGRKLTEEENERIRNGIPPFLKIIQEETHKMDGGNMVADPSSRKSVIVGCGHTAIGRILCPEVK